MGMVMGMGMVMRVGGIQADGHPKDAAAPEEAEHGPAQLECCARRAAEPDQRMGAGEQEPVSPVG